MISAQHRAGSVKQSLLKAAVLLALLLVGFLFLLPRFEDARRNAVAGLPPATDPQALAFHNSLFVADLHADSLLWNRDMLTRHEYGHVDEPRLLVGNMSLQVFSVVTKTPFNLNLFSNSDRSDTITLLAVAQRWPVKTWTSLYARALYQAGKLQQYADNPASVLRPILYRQDLLEFQAARLAGSRGVATVLSLEGGHALEGNLAHVDGLYAAGFRVLGFAHFFDNELGGSAYGLAKGGLTPFGLRVLQRMEQLGMLVDVAHASESLIDDIFAIATQPVISTHTGVKGLCREDSRNLSDQHIRAIAGSGGVIGVGFWPSATCSDEVQGITDSIRYVIDLVGVDYVALGSDFDGNVQAPFDVAHLSLLTESLRSSGLADADIRKVMGENVERLFLSVLADRPDAGL